MQPNWLPIWEVRDNFHVSEDAVQKEPKMENNTMTTQIVRHIYSSISGHKREQSLSLYQRCGLGWILSQKYSHASCDFVGNDGKNGQGLQLAQSRQLVTVVAQVHLSVSIS